MRSYDKGMLEYRQKVQEIYSRHNNGQINDTDLKVELDMVLEQVYSFGYDDAYNTLKGDT